MSLSSNQIIGGVGEDRTPDPLRARQVLSQLSYDPFAAIFFLAFRWKLSFAQLHTDVCAITPSIFRLNQEKISCKAFLLQCLVQFRDNKLCGHFDD